MQRDTCLLRRHSVSAEPTLLLHGAADTRWLSAPPTLEGVGAANTSLLRRGRACQLRRHLSFVHRALYIFYMFFHLFFHVFFTYRFLCTCICFKTSLYIHLYYTVYLSVFLYMVDYFYMFSCAFIYFCMFCVYVCTCVNIFLYNRLSKSFETHCIIFWRILCIINGFNILFKKH